MNSVLFSQTRSSAQAYPVWWPDLNHHHEKGLVTVKHNAHSCDLTSGMWGVCSELEQYMSVELDVVDTAHKLCEEECYPLWYKQANY